MVCSICDLGFVSNSRGNKAAANLRPISCINRVLAVWQKCSMASRWNVWIQFVIQDKTLLAYTYQCKLLHTRYLTQYYHNIGFSFQIIMYCNWIHFNTYSLHTSTYHNKCLLGAKARVLNWNLIYPITYMTIH